MVDDGLGGGVDPCHPPPPHTHTLTKVGPCDGVKCSRTIVVDDGLGGGVDTCHPPHTNEHVVDEVHWYKVCYPKLAVSADSQHSLPNLCKVRRGDMGRRRGGKKWGGEEGIVKVK